MTTQQEHLTKSGDSWAHTARTAENHARLFREAGDYDGADFWQRQADDAAAIAADFYRRAREVQP